MLRRRRALRGGGSLIRSWVTRAERAERAERAQRGPNEAPYEAPNDAPYMRLLVKALYEGSL